MNCACCGREVTRITKHHLMPRSRHHNKKVRKEFARQKLNSTIALCGPCHGQIHTLFTEKELARDYHELKDIKSHPQMSKFTRWIKDKPPDFRLKIKR